jgi:uncharacterized protein
MSLVGTATAANVGDGAGLSAPATPARPAATPRTGPRPKRQPVRTCVACRTTGGKRGLLRVVRVTARPDGGDAGAAAKTVRVELDPTGKKNGRGAYVCPTLACVQTALKRKALERSLKTPITEDVATALRGAVAVSPVADSAEESPTGT